MIVEYSEGYSEQVKDLLVELQKYISSIDIEGYNIVGNQYREKYFKEMLKNINEKNGKVFLYKENEKIIGLVAGIINNDKITTFDFNAPKRGRITELVVDKNYRGKGIGKVLLQKMSNYLKSQGSEKIMIAVFGYNEKAIKFYQNNGFHVRMLDMIENEQIIKEGED